MRPQAIVRFEQLYIISLILSVVSAVWSYMRLSIVLPTDAPRALVPVTMIVATAIGLIIGILLLYFIARRGSEIAKWIFIIFFVIGVIGFIRLLASFGAITHVAPMVSAVTLGIALIQIVLQAVCVWLLFRPDAKAWFKGARTPEDLHDTFS
ncbi:MAG TPA: hypothetical protein VFL92_08185 [Sphingomonas sp.]|nr:hypothetical protein [Sphingomonas sp.]